MITTVPSRIIMDRKCAIVLTTIHQNDVLQGYFENLNKYGHLENACIIVIPDRKTPSEVYARCQELSKCGLDIACPTLADQDEFLNSLGGFASLIPYNSDNRRNVGFLMALQRGVDFLVSIDDDNYCSPDSDFLSEHGIVCSPSQELDVVESTSGWFNICELLQTVPPVCVYPRGFPYRQRHTNSYQQNRRRVTGAIRVNAGLWLCEPDLDGMTWLTAPVRAIATKGPSVTLALGTWTPINSQNTALHRDAIPSYYFVRMGYPLAGTKIDRYGDIFSGYFMQACARQMGHLVRVGTPVADHRRNRHNYLSDAMAELPCILVLEDMLEWLREAKPEGTSYATMYASLADAIDDIVEGFHGSIWNDSTRGCFHQMTYCMRRWLRACEAI